MKKAILFLVSLIALTNYSNASTFVISGKLLDDVNLNGRINKMIFTENKDEVKLLNEYVESFSCDNGQFEVEEAFEGEYRLKKVISCESWFDATQEVESCPENFMPVCGEVEESLGKSLPQMITFSNACEMYRAKASFIYNGSCK